ncbi:hypothetical protein SPRG_15167 [Saprolegnia parasitica CBS 223.65]|uniref:Uncharacterized protein n=1 Tax=Saprolegnia parasitica (strain CBS 223.65) TaxID=695850 RepID=A0A067BJU0_SAPPC|nr:hypothetical protein SPRG_15167 [Saprolegnia parasitica CBS 223.65]KDO18458.1 hypothetical protein SPRG_15167 [Saprolegnia parasitica CBS 223.65]|eukprot:XP_012210836.1 hypothetical protein SPRG_15167 [Saprolegnia parasitica CBS 223.65]
MGVQYRARDSKPTTMPILLQDDHQHTAPMTFTPPQPERSTTKPVTSPLTHDEDEACQSMLLVNYII